MGRPDTVLKLADFFAIFPLQPDAKIPLPGSQGFKDATQDKDVLAEIWESTPTANIGVYPWGGPVKYVVFDFEGEDKGNDLAHSLKLWQRKTGHPLDLSDNFVISTPSQGVHVYFKVDAEDERVYTSTVNFVKGCDIRAYGGYVLGPGSVASGKPYEVKCAKLPRPLPPKVSKVLPLQRGRVENNEADEAELDLAHNLKRTQAFLETTEPAIEGEGGDNWTYATAVKVRNFGLSQAKCLEFLLRYWNPRCEPPWEADELGLKVEHAYKYALEKQGVDGGDPNQAFGGMIEAGAEAAPAGPSRFRLLKGGELTTWPAPVWTVRKIIPERGIGLLIGPWGSYKSFVAIDLAASIACGKDFGGRELKHQGPVIYLAGEGPYGIRLRFLAWLKQQNIEGWPEEIALVPDLPNFGDPAQVKEFVAEAREFAPRLVVIDTLSQATLGADENSAKDMGAVIDGMKYIRDALDCFVLGVHHMGKDESKGSRGWSGLPAAADIEIQVKASSVKREAYVLLNKIRDAERWEKKEVFSAQSIDLGVDGDGDTLTSLAFRHNPNAKPPESGTKEDRDVMRWNAIKDILGTLDYPITTTALATQLLPATVEEEDIPEDKEARDKLIGNLARWLQRQAEKEEGARWVVMKGGTGSRETLMWRTPPEPQPDDTIPW
jgi:hypothetical protein